MVLTSCSTCTAGCWCHRHSLSISTNLNSTILGEASDWSANQSSKAHQPTAQIIMVVHIYDNMKIILCTTYVYTMNNLSRLPTRLTYYFSISLEFVTHDVNMTKSWYNLITKILYFSPSFVSSSNNGKCELDRFVYDKIGRRSLDFHSAYIPPFFCVIFHREL